MCEFETDRNDAMMEAMLEEEKMTRSPSGRENSLGIGENKRKVGGEDRFEERRKAIV